jgi:hypothetical protein
MDQPIACSLDPADARAQLDSWEAVFSATVVSVERATPNSVRMRLKDDAAATGSLVALAQREVACCPFFRFDLEVTVDGTMFTASVPSEASAILDDFVKLAAS